MNKGWIAPSLILLGILGVWYFIGKYELVYPSLYARPVDVALTILNDWKSYLLNSLSSSLTIIIGVALGTVAGFTLALFSHVNRVAKHVFPPVVAMFAPIPIIVWAPFAIALLGYGIVYQAFMVSVPALAICFIACFQQFRMMPERYQGILQINEISGWKALVSLYLPVVIPGLAFMLRITLALSWIVLFLVEYGNDESWATGLGYMVSKARTLGQTETVFAASICLAFFAFVIDWITAKMFNLLLRWEK